MIIFTYGACGFTTFFGVSYPRLSQWFSRNCTTLELDNRLNFNDPWYVCPSMVKVFFLADGLNRNPLLWPFLILAAGLLHQGSQT